MDAARLERRAADPGRTRPSRRCGTPTPAGELGDERRLPGPLRPDDQDTGPTAGDEAGVQVEPFGFAIEGPAVDPAEDSALARPFVRPGDLALPSSHSSTSESDLSSCPGCTKPIRTSATRLGSLPCPGSGMAASSWSNRSRMPASEVVMTTVTSPTRTGRHDSQLTLESRQVGLSAIASASTAHLSLPGCACRGNEGRACSRRPAALSRAVHLQVRLCVGVAAKRPP